MFGIDRCSVKTGKFTKIDNIRTKSNVQFTRISVYSGFHCIYKVLFYFRVNKSAPHLGSCLLYQKLQVSKYRVDSLNYIV